MAVVFGVPFSQAVIEMRQGRLPQFLDLFRRAPTEKNLRTFERALEESSLYARALRPWVQSLWFTAFSNSGEKTVLGRDGWLFYKPDVRYLVEPYGVDDPLSAIVSFRNQLVRRGVHLLVVPVPGKPSVYADKLTRRAGSGVASHTRELAGRLRRAGVETVDLSETFLQLRQKDRMPAGEPYYLAHDTHWSGTAARIAAQVVACRLRALGWFSEGSTEYQTRQVVFRRRGDLIRMLDVPGIERHFPAEEVHCQQVIEKGGGTLYADDPHSPVLVLGDSFLRMYQTDAPRAAGFIAHLARELKMPLASIVNDGGASTLVRQELSRRPELLKHKRVVIWEFVERDIRFGTEGWKYIPLP